MLYVTVTQTFLLFYLWIKVFSRLCEHVSDFAGDDDQPPEPRPALVAVSPAWGCDQGPAPPAGLLQHLPAAVQEEAGLGREDHRLQVTKRHICPVS